MQGTYPARARYVRRVMFWEATAAQKTRSADAEARIHHLAVGVFLERAEGPSSGVAASSRANADMAEAFGGEARARA